MVVIRAGLDWETRDQVVEKLNKKLDELRMETTRFHQAPESNADEPGSETTNSGFYLQNGSFLSRKGEAGNRLSYLGIANADGKDVNRNSFLRYPLAKFFDVDSIILSLQNQKNPSFLVGLYGIVLGLLKSFIPFLSKIAFYRMCFGQAVHPSVFHRNLKSSLTRKTEFRHKICLMMWRKICPRRRFFTFIWVNSWRTQFFALFIPVTMAFTFLIIVMTPCSVYPTRMS